MLKHEDAPGLAKLTRIREGDSPAAGASRSWWAMAGSTIRRSCAAVPTVP